MLNADGPSSHRENTQQKSNEGTAYIQSQPGQQNSSNAKITTSISKMSNGNIYQSANAKVPNNITVTQNG